MGELRVVPLSQNQQETHATVAALLLFAFTGALALREVHSPRRDLLLGAAVGLAAGWATVTEYPALPAAAMLALLKMVHLWRSGRTIGRVAAGVIVGALICVVVLMSYQYFALGSPFRISYSYITYDVPPPSPKMGHGLFGVTYPRLWSVRELLVGRYRGLLLLAPVLTLAPVGFVHLWRRSGSCASVSWQQWLSSCTTFCSMRQIDTGTEGFRPVRGIWRLLPLLCLALGLGTWSRPVHRVLLVILALYGVFVALMAVSTDPMPGTDVKSPVQELFWPAFRSGHLGTFNFGKLVGLHGLPSLLPLLLIWIIGLASWLWLERRTERREGYLLEPSRRIRKR